jgi:shikimate dehydrogenase
MRAIHASIPTTIQLEYALAPSPEHNDRLLAGMAPHSLVINATGLGKDRPGSPLTDQAVFPAEALVWDFNYRGDLRFLDQARCQQTSRSLTLEDGWVYFLHGWTRVISEVFHIDIPTAGPRFDALSESARKARA